MGRPQWLSGTQHVHNMDMVFNPYGFVETSSSVVCRRVDSAED